MGGTRPQRRLGHLPALDGVRGLAVLLVVVLHGKLLLVAVPQSGFFTPGAVSDRLRDFLAGGHLGVDVFFVLSGFLITALLVQEDRERGRVGLGGFYRRRVVRLLPALYVLLGLHVVYAATTGLSMSDEWMSVRDALLYVSNWSWRWDPLRGASGLGHLWSLAIEEQFYLVWPAVVVVALRLDRGGRLLMALTAGGIVTVVVWRAALHDGGHIVYFLYTRTDARVDGLLLGALLAQAWVRGWRFPPLLPFIGWAAAAVLAVAVATVGVEDDRLYQGGYTVISLLIAVVLAAILEGRWAGARFFELAPLRALGKVSYGLYLWHFVVFDVVIRYGAGWGAAARIAVGSAATALVTLLSWRFVEQPALRWRRSLRHRTEQPLAPAGATLTPVGPTGAAGAAPIE